MADLYRAREHYRVVRFDGSLECLQPLYPVTGRQTFDQDESGVLWIEGGFIDQGAREGDFILRDQHGNLSVLDAEDFARRFEKVEEA